MLLLKQFFVVVFFSAFETDLIKKRKKKSNIKEEIENGNFQNSRFMLLFSNITLNTSQSN